MTNLNGQLSIEDLKARNYILAGNATVTIRSIKTGTRFTYKIQHGDNNWDNTDRWFVKLLQGPDNDSSFGYLGMITHDKQFTKTRATCMSTKAPSFVAWQWVWERINKGQMCPDLEVWHEGTCGKCGRKLTVPESVETGLGPVCATKM